MQVNYNGSYTLSQPTRIPQMLNSYQYATYVNEYDADPRTIRAVSLIPMKCCNII
jgi:hypothetical protein